MPPGVTKSEELRRRIMATPRGQAMRAFLQSQVGADFLEELKKTYVHVPVFSPDPLTLARNAGQHDLVLDLVAFARLAEKEPQHE